MATANKISSYLLAKELGLDHQGDVREVALPQHFEVTLNAATETHNVRMRKHTHATNRGKYKTKGRQTYKLGHVDDGGLARVRLGRLVHTGRDHAPQPVDVDALAVVRVPLVVERPHAHLTEVTRVVLIHQNTVVVLTTGVTAATGVGPVLADAAVAWTREERNIEMNGR